MGIDLAREQVPEATTLLRFRRLLEGNQPMKAIFERGNVHLGERGLLLHEGTLLKRKKAQIRAPAEHPFHVI